MIIISVYIIRILQCESRFYSVQFSSHGDYVLIFCQTFTTMNLTDLYEIIKQSKNFE